MGDGPIQPVIQPITIGTMLKKITGWISVSDWISWAVNAPQKGKRRLFKLYSSIQIDSID